jgi:hypothetical protein
VLSVEESAETAEGREAAESGEAVLSFECWVENVGHRTLNIPSRSQKGSDE